MNEIRSVLQQALAQLTPHSPEPRLEAEILLCHILKKNRAYLMGHTDDELTPEHQEAYLQCVKQRAQGVPIAYIIGTRDFWSLTLKVTPATLIPRHETERLVELALELIPDAANTRILDLGTGSGAVALAIAKERPHWQIDACDLSQDALDVAKENALTNGVSNVRFIHSNWFASIPPQLYQAIVSNPPYIAPDDPHLHQGDLRFEPSSALISSQAGLADLNLIIKTSQEYLAPQGLLLLEHGHDQKNQLNAILNGLGYINVQCWQDILGHDRVSGGWHSDKSL